jgi:parallel beta-helix repeat protein
MIQCGEINNMGKSVNGNSFVFLIALLFICSSVVSAVDMQVNNINVISSGRGNTFYVGGSSPFNYTSIQDAIDNSSDGDTVFVFTGKYYGHVTLNKSINLIGEDKNATFIIGFVAYTISIVSDWVNMSGFTVLNEGRLGEGVRIDSCFNNFINNIVNTPNDEIRIFGDNNNFSDNTIICDRVYVSGKSNTIYGNTITNKYYGIYLTDSWDNIISNNSFFNSGLFIHGTAVWKNTVTNNTVNGKILVYMHNKSDLIIDIEAGQIILINCSNITVQNQELSNTTAGIQILGSDNCTFSGNTITNNYYGIYLYGWNNTIKSNTIFNNSEAIRVSGDSNTIHKNTLTSNNVAIYLDSYTNHNNVINNIITNNNYCIQLDSHSDFNNIINNKIRNNHDAIRISGDWNTILGNTITNNNDEGVKLVYGNYNSIVNNNIKNNSGTGIHMVNSDYNNIFNNSITKNNYEGIQISGDNNTISGNTITNNNNGICVVNQKYNIIKGNSISGNKVHGIYLNCSNNNTVSDNSITKNTQGIHIFSSTSNYVIKNNFINNQRDAFFEISKLNKWNHNYWNRPRLFPKIIFGTISINSIDLPWFNMDLNPSIKPYDIGL